MRRRAGIGLDINDLASRRAVRAFGRDRVDNMVERPVVQDAAVHEPLIFLARPVIESVSEVLGDASRILVRRRLGGRGVNRREETAQADRRERTGKARGGPGGEGQGRHVAEIGRVPDRGGTRMFLVVVKTQQLAVRHVGVRAAAGAAGNHRLVTVHVGGRDEQVQAFIRPDERRLDRLHLFQRRMEQVTHQIAVEHRRLRVPAQPGDRLGELGQHLPPPPGEESVTGEQDRHVAFVKPELPETIQRTSPGQATGQADPVDAAGRGTRDDVQHHGERIALVGQRVERGEIGLLTVVIRPALHLGRTGEPALRIKIRLRIGVIERSCGAHELVKLLGHAVHVDGQRDTAVADQPQPDLLNERCGRIHRDGRTDGGRIRTWISS